MRLNQSQRIPSWLWKIISLSLSIKLATQRRFWVGFSLFVFTAFAAACLASTSTFYIIYDIRSNLTRSTVFTGTSDISFGVCWVSLGTYSNYLAHRVFTSRILYDSVRLHTRTLFKINIALLVLILAFTEWLLRIYLDYETLLATRCDVIKLPRYVCYIRYLSGTVYGFTAIYWSMMVAWSLLSICRTHTIGCRRFIRELEFEGKVIEKLYHLRQSDPTLESTDDTKPSDFMSALESTDEEEPAVRQHHVRFAPTVEASAPPESNEGIWESMETASTSVAGEAGTHREGSSVTEKCENIEKSNGCGGSSMLQTRRKIFRQLQLKGARDTTLYQQLLLTTDDICMQLWKLECHLRITSLVYQGWMIILLIVSGLWVLNYLIFWINNPADILQLADFFLPIILVAILCSGFAEVNLECKRICQAVCPRAERLMINRYIVRDPPSLTVYSVALTYKVLGGTVMAFVLAFTSRIVMDELRKK